MSIALIVLLLVLFALNIPIAFSLGIASLIILFFLDIPFLVLPQRMFTGTDSFILTSIPFFLLAGSLMEYGGISKRLINFANTLVGHIKGGLGLIAVLSSALFAGVSGSAVADTAAIGKITIPAMIKQGYSKSYATAIQSTAGALGIIIPPSIVMILYCVISGESVGKMFLGGVIPGILLAIVLMITGYLFAAKRDYPVLESELSIKKVFKSFVSSIPALLMPVIILACITLGITTATESAVIAVVYGLIVGMFIYKELKISDIPKILDEVLKTTSMVMMIVAAASVFAWVLTSQGFSFTLGSILTGVSSNPTWVLMIFVIVFLIAGTFLDTSAALIIIVPVILPIAQSVGIDPLQLGVITVITLAIGLATPPVGLNLFVAAGIAKVDVITASKEIWPYVAVMVIVVILLVLFPQLITFLPNIID